MSAEVTVGSRLGAYALEAIIAEGGFGTVFRASGGPRGAAAVKLLHAELAGSPEALARFAREVEVLRLVRHPGIVEVLEVGRADDGRPWFAMELLDGVDLDSHLARRGRLTPGAALAILAPVCDALARAHDAGVIHRDIKASNVFLADDGRVVLLDFGIAKLSDPFIGGGLTLSRQALGTPSAMAPEQVAGRAASERTDVYGLGVRLYHMLVGEPPFADSSASVMQYLHCHARRPRPSTRASLPAALDDVVATAMAIEVDRRHAGPRELHAACRAAVGAEETAGQVRAALAVRVDVRVGADADAGELGPALDDAEAVWSAARAHFCTRGFVPALEASESMLFVRPLADAGPDGVAEFEQLVTERAGRHPAVSVAVLSRSGDVSFAGRAPLAGSLLAISDW
jgi:eukaryotic-like serine/threonine-protein kinase